MTKSSKVGKLFDCIETTLSESNCLEVYIVPTSICTETTCIETTLYGNDWLPLIQGICFCFCLLSCFFSTEMFCNIARITGVLWAKRGDCNIATCFLWFLLSYLTVGYQSVCDVTAGICWSSRKVSESGKWELWSGFQGNLWLEMTGTADLTGV